MRIHGFNYSATSFGTLKTALHPEETGTAFAADIRRRISQTQVPQKKDAEGVETQTGEDATVDKQAELDRLEASMSATVAYVSEKHGADAATAMMGVMYKSLGEGEVNEETLGNALLDVTRFIDRQFGIESGDDFMDHLNGQLNESLNAYFDNGKSEQFFSVMTSSPGEVGATAATGALREGVAEVTDQYAKNIIALIEQARAANSHNGTRPYGAPVSASAIQGVLADVTV